RGFKNTALRPLLGAIGGVFVLSFILSFTDFGIPVSIGGTYNVVATYLFEVMLGSIPDFDRGSVIAMLMLTPVIFAVWLLNYLEKFNFHYDLAGQSELPKNRLRDNVMAFFSLLVTVAVLAVFLVMFIAPFVKNYPYDLTFTAEFFTSMVTAGDTRYIYFNSVRVACYTAFFGTLLAYLAAVVNIRSQISPEAKIVVDVFAIMTNAVPGMVLGLAMLFFFNASDLKGTFLLLTVCNIIHFFTTPYLMAKNSLSKLNPAWETTGALMGDTWLKTLMRVIVPNSKSTLIEMFSYYFINAMVTISAIIFLVSTVTSVLTSKIKELQHYAQFNEIFVLSLLIFATNIIVKLGCDLFSRKISAHKG
ncbi:MAG: ABC transporter permease subunit, partial [Acidaminococcales bacterium]|nr:ABC transporter permease subunit [Acidaminococcales bacterium]